MRQLGGPAPRGDGLGGGVAWSCAVRTARGGTLGAAAAQQPLRRGGPTDAAGAAAREDGGSGGAPSVRSGCRAQWVGGAPQNTSSERSGGGKSAAGWPVRWLHAKG